jgi:tetratricopeptide (TPR) repeat protein
MSARIRALALGVAVVLAAVRAGAAVDAAGDAESWARARAAYDAGAWSDALDAYTALAAAGGSAEAMYNAGNAAYRMGEPGRAVAWYRRAWRQRPRDPDVRANLELALRAAGATETPAPAWRRALLQLHRDEARLLRAAGWIAGWFLLAVLAIPFRRGRSAVVAGAVLAGLVWLAGLAVGEVWRRADQPPEAVVVRKNARALFAPIAGATVHYAPPPGTTVRVVGESEMWIKADWNGREGWLPAADLARTSPDAR